MHKRIKTIERIFILLTAGIFMPICLLCGCGESVPADADVIGTDNLENEEESGDGKLSEEKLERLTKGDVHMSAGQLADFASGVTMRYDEASESLICTFEMPRIPGSDDAYLYLFALESYENEDKLSSEPVSSGIKGTTCEIAFPYTEDYLFERFVPALYMDGRYVPLSQGVYLTNPEALAGNRDPYPEISSKKGLLLDPTMLGTEKLTDLGVKHAIYNIPLSHIMGVTTDETFPTITYTYKGKDYVFNGAAINGYDGLFRYLTEMGMCSTAIILNDWNDEYPELIHPDARQKNDDAYYYMANAAEEEGVITLEAVANFLTERYSGGEYGMVYNWVIANEINQQRTWNYMDTQDVGYYAQEFEKVFRIFYLAARSSYANAKVYFSVDHIWNREQGNGKDFFNARDVIEQFNIMAATHGNYDWGIAIHPYPDPLTRVNYWSQEYSKTQEAQTLTIMNLSVLTDFLKQEAYLDSHGEVRSITITELGFSSQSGEKLQAAAFAYCYLIVDANPYIEAFIMNRQTDAPEEVAQGLAFGIYRYDQSEKYIKDVFRYIDTDKASEYTEFMLNILKADNLEEALGWAE